MERGISLLTLGIVSLSFLVAPFVDSVLEGRDSRRLGANKKLGCSYGDERYQHGDPVKTPEPCLNCTCTRGVLVCYLRVCPTLVPPSPDCFAVKEADDCCATMVCNSIYRTKTNESTEHKNHFHGRTLTNTLHVYKKPEVVHITNNHRSPARTTAVPDSTTTVVNTETLWTTENTSQSLLIISSTPSPLPKDFDIFLNSITGCYVNGTIYAEGSAMISSSFCEYCYCIRGKQMCVRPKCHLSIEGCSPRYFSQYTCCPTRYLCNEKRKIYRVTSPPTTTSTTTTTTISPETFSPLTTEPSGCTIEGTWYAVGDPVPSTAHCQTCYCSAKGVVCTSVTCSPAMEGCEPVIPEGHCCPLEFKCNFTQTPPPDIQESTIEMSKENSNETANHSLETTLPPSASSINETTEELHEIINDTTSMEPEAAVDSALSPAIMRENDRIIYFPEFAGNLRRRISETASLLGYSTKHTNKGPFHSFRTPVIYNRNNERMMYLSKLGEGLLPRRAAGRGKSDFDQEMDLVEADSDILSASADLHITNFERRTKDFSFPAEDTTTPKEVTSVETLQVSVLAEDFRQNSEDKNPVKILKPEERMEKTSAISADDTTLDPSTKLSTLEDTPQTLPSRPPFALDGNITTDNVTDDYYSEISMTTEDSDKTTVTIGMDGDKDASATFSPQPPTIDTTIYFTSAKISHSTDWPTSKTNHSTAELPSLYSTGTELIGNDEEFSSDSSNNSITNDPSGSKSPKEYSTFLPGISANVTDSESNTTLISSIEDEAIVNGSTSETSKGIWYSDPGITTVTPSENNVSPSSKLDDKKRPRQKEQNSRFKNNMRIIPFLAKDAITNRPYSRPVRNRTATQSSAEVVTGHCVVNNRIYINGEMIGSSDPCSLCRCFYGKALCQQQRCQPSPSPDCFPERSSDDCCPRYVCGKDFTDSPSAPAISTSTQYTPQEKLNWHALSSQTSSQLVLQTVEEVNTQTTPLSVTTSHSPYADAIFEERRDDPIMPNEKYPPKSDVGSSSPSTDQPTKPVTVIAQSDDTSEERSPATEPLVGPYPEGIKSEFWALLRVSGCNIYGQYYQLNEKISELSDECKDCICTKDGVKCSKFC